MPAVSTSWNSPITSVSSLNPSNSPYDLEDERTQGRWTRGSAPKATILTFASGKSVVVGARDLKDIEEAFDIMRDQLVSGDFEIWDTPHEISLRNLVVVHQIGQDLDLKQLSVTLPFMRTEYEPEQFPGLIYRQDVNSQEAVCLIFSSGKCVITGCASFEDAEEAASMLADTLGDAL